VREEERSEERDGDGNGLESSTSSSGSGISGSDRALSGETLVERCVCGLMVVLYDSSSDSDGLAEGGLLFVRHYRPGVFDFELGSE
jgi:hypothetical protein